MDWHHDVTDYNKIDKLTVIGALRKIFKTLDTGTKKYQSPRPNQTVKEYNRTIDFDNYINGVVWYLNYVQYSCEYKDFYKGTGPTLCCPISFWKHVTMAFAGFECTCDGDVAKKGLCIIKAYKQYLASRNKPWYEDLDLLLLNFGTEKLNITWTLDGSFAYKRGGTEASLPVLFINSPLVHQIDASNCGEFLNFVKLHDFPVPDLSVQKIW